MLIKWEQSLSIGVPEIDMEHKYLIVLVNKIHDDFIAGRVGNKLSVSFAQLIKYTDRHFKNEESLMSAINYPLLEEHKLQHDNLTEQATLLSEKYVTGEDNISVKTLEFLKDWIFEHVISQDLKIAKYIKINGYPKNWIHVPAFAGGYNNNFMVCSSCGKKWKTFNELIKDKEKKVLGTMVDEESYFFNMILFNCSCDSTLAIKLTDFIDYCSVAFEESINSTDNPSYCMRDNKSSPCLTKCACGYTSNILNLLNKG